MTSCRSLVRFIRSHNDIRVNVFKGSHYCFTSISLCGSGSALSSAMTRNDEKTAASFSGGTNMTDDDDKEGRHKRKNGELSTAMSENKKQAVDCNKGSFRKHDLPNEKNTIPHDGSYASKAMQEQFKFSIPEDSPYSQTKVSKKKLAMLMSYVGSKFAGFQMNKDQLTVQAELESALFKAGLLQKSNFGFPHKYGWSVSGRTDKGVHACAQVCSAKLEVGDMSEDEIRERINQQLHPDILILDVKRTLRSFCAKTQRNRVRYQYMIPSYLFYPNAKQLFAEIGIGERQLGSAPLTPGEIQSLRSKVKDYRISPEQLAMLKASLAKYVGTHSYHNFTRGMNVGDPSGKRYIIDFSVDDPMIQEDGTEWIATQVLGQAFLLNQIRKMIALACDVVCERASLETMEHALDERTRMILPIAPAQGLFLDMSVYDYYNKRKGKCSHEAPDLDWVDNPESPAMLRWKEFKEDRVLKTIFEEERNFGNFVLYLFVQTNFFEWEDKYRLDGRTE